MNNLIDIATIITSLTTIIIGVYKINKAINNFTNDFKRYHLYTLKIAILSEELPLVDRIHAGEEYLKLGGNGLVKKKYEELLEIAYKEMIESDRFQVKVKK